jgi:FHA domain/Domain of unknown function (DUF1707)
VVTVPLRKLREETLQTLRCHYAVGHVRLATLEHRIEAALAAQTADQLSAVTWDLPALDASIWQTLKAHVVEQGPQRPCSCVCFRSVPEVTLPLGPAPATWCIGRHPTCDVVLRHPAVSRRHALLSVRGERCSVRDFNSTNGVQVNGRAVETSVLHPGDVLTFGAAVHAVVR